MTTLVTALLGALVAGWGWYRAHLAGDRERAERLRREHTEGELAWERDQTARLESLITERDREIARAWSAADACAATDPAAALRLLRYELDPTGARAAPAGLPPGDAPAAS